MGIHFIVDGTNLVSTIWHANKSRGYAREYLADMLQDFYRWKQPAATSIAFDFGGETFRHKIFDGYKAKRKPKDPDLVEEINAAKWNVHCTDLFNTYSVPGYEADDIVATLVKNWLDADDANKCVVVSRDKDLRQLIQEGRVNVVRKTERRGRDFSYEFCNQSAFIAETSLHPSQWVDFLALAGDPSDSWPGVKGCGEIAAKRLLVKYGSAREAQKRATEEDLRAKVLTALREFDFDLAFKICGLCDAVPLGDTIDPVPYAEEKTEKF